MRALNPAERLSRGIERQKRAKAFTLVEMLVVVAVVAVLSGLMVPAVQGLMGSSGRRGALNTVTAVLEQARIAAIESGTSAYVGFPTTAQDKTNGYSRLIIFRDPRPGEAAPVALTRWQRLPTGVYFQAGDNFTSATTNRSVTLPRLGGENLTQIPALGFNRFGQLQGANQEVSILLGEKLEPEGDWRGGSRNFYQLKIQPLTGRVVVTDGVTGGAP